MLEMNISCFQVAEYFLWKAKESGSFLSNLKLQKLVYYAQAWHLANFRSPLFNERIEGWVHGPVVAELYQKYKIFSYNPILVKGLREPSLSIKITSYLDEVAKVYFAHDALTLEIMTHNEEPWKLSRRGLSPQKNGNKEITHASMKNYYGEKIKNKRG